MSNAMDMYCGAAEKFSQYAAICMDNLVKVRDAYEEALQASDEIRKTVTSRDESIKSVMAQLQEIVNVHLLDKGHATKALEMPTEEELQALLRHAEPEKTDGKIKGEALATSNTKPNFKRWP